MRKYQQNDVYIYQCVFEHEAAGPSSQTSPEGPGKYRGSYMSAHVLLNLLNELGKRDKMRGLPSILSLFRNAFNKFNNT